MDADKLLSNMNQPDSYFAFRRRILRGLTRSLHRDHGVWVLLYDSIKWLNLNLFSNASSASTWTSQQNKSSSLQTWAAVWIFHVWVAADLYQRQEKWPHTWGISVVQRKRLPLCYFCPAKPFSSFTCACVSQAVRMRRTSGEHAHLWKVCVHTLNDPLPKRPVPDCSDLSVGSFSFPAA